jgi:DUF971 family protein
MAEKRPRPVSINLRRKSRILAIAFDDGAEFELGFELLRVFSPSAEVRGHGPGQEVLVTGKEDVDILEVEPVGNYAVRLRFDDGHDSGIYGWDYLYDLGRRRDWYWQRYLERLRAAGIGRKGK